MDQRQQRVSPFQEFTGYKLWEQQQQQRSRNNNRAVSSNNNWSEGLRELDLVVVDARDPKQQRPRAFVPTQQQQQQKHHKESDHSSGNRDTTVPNEIVTVVDAIPHEIRIPDGDDLLAGEAVLDSFDHSDLSSDEAPPPPPLASHRWESFRSDQAHKFLFPPLSKHHNVQHDATWGITTATLDEKGCEEKHDSSKVPRLLDQKQPPPRVVPEKKDALYWPSDEENALTMQTTTKGGNHPIDSFFPRMFEAAKSSTVPQQWSTTPDFHVPGDDDSWSPADLRFSSACCGSVGQKKKKRHSYPCCVDGATT